MASSISPLSYLDASPYQSLFPTTSTATEAGLSAVSPTAEVQALQKQGNFQAFINESVVASLLEPDGTTGGTAANTLIDNMLQQVLGAYQAPGTSLSASGTSVVG
jgi:hypothetical protein